MQTTVTLHWSGTDNKGVGAKVGSTNARAALSISKVYKQHVHDLYNYGMNACNDSVLVKNCIEQCFLFMGDRPQLLEKDQPVVINVFKTVRRFLIQEKETDLFTSKTEMTLELSSIQQEALFLKFQRSLSYREVAIIMDLPIEQLRRQISNAFGILIKAK